MGVSENTAVITKAYTAYVYRYDGSTWIEEAKLESSHHASDFGICAALFGDIALVGADLDNHNGPHSGSVYAFHGLSDCRPNGSPSCSAPTTPPTPGISMATATRTSAIWRCCWRIMGRFVGS